METTELELQRTYDEYSTRADDCRTDLLTLADQLEAVATKLVDCKPGERASVLQERRVLAGERDARGDELRVLAGRRDTALLAIHEMMVAKAETAANICGDASRLHRKSLDAAVIERRILWNGGRAKMTPEEGDKKAVDLDMLIAKLKAEEAIMSRDAQKVVHALENARAALNDARHTVLIPV